MKLLKFYADWCGPCHVLSKVMQSWDQRVLDIVENVDVDTKAGNLLCSKYGVRGVPSLILVREDGSEIQRYSSNYKNTQESVLEHLRN